MDHLSDNILLKIFGHVKKDSDKIKRVCKRFYLLICKMNGIKKEILVSERKLQDKKDYNLMLCSTNIYSDMTIDTSSIKSLDSFYKLRTICSLNAPTVTSLTWKKSKLTAIETIGIINLFKNLHSLCCNSWDLCTQYFDDPTEPLKLNLLESLSITDSNEATIALFNHYLPANSLINLEIGSYCNDDEYSQSGISASDDDEREYDEDCYDEYSGDKSMQRDVPKPTLTHLRPQLKKYEIKHQTPLRSILQHQQNLVTLKILSGFGINDQTFATLCSLKNLKVLKINTDDIKPSAFKKNFNKLKKLEDLHIEALQDYDSSSLTNIKELSKTNLEHLKSLTIHVRSTEIPATVIKKMGINFPKLSKLSLQSEIVSLPLDVYLKNFKALTCIEIKSKGYSESSSISRTRFPLINRLYLGSDLNEAEFLKLPKAFPNVTDMKIKTSISLNEKVLNCLKMFTKLKNLHDVTFVQQVLEKFDEDIVNLLIAILIKFKFVSIEINYKRIDMELKTMKVMFMEKFEFSINRASKNIQIRNK